MTTFLIPGFREVKWQLRPLCLTVQRGRIGLPAGLLQGSVRKLRLGRNLAFLIFNPQDLAWHPAHSRPSICWMIGNQCKLSTVSQNKQLYCGLSSLHM